MSSSSLVLWLHLSIHEFHIQNYMQGKGNTRVCGTKFQGALHGWQGMSTWIYAGQHLTTVNAVISQEENLGNSWNFCESVQKLNKLVSTSAHKYMWSDNIKEKAGSCLLSALIPQWECHMERKKADERNTNCYIIIKKPNIYLTRD